MENNQITNEEFRIYEKVRLAIIRDEIKGKLSGYSDEDEVIDGCTYASINNDEFFDYVTGEMVKYMDNVDSDEIWYVITNCIERLNGE